MPENNGSKNMKRKLNLYNKEIKSVIIVLASYFLTILFISLYRNSFQLFPFCGSLRDFTDQGPVPAVCIELPEYLYRASMHPDFALPASITAIILGLGYYGEIWKHLEKLREGF